MTIIKLIKSKIQKNKNFCYYKFQNQNIRFDSENKNCKFSPLISIFEGKKLFLRFLKENNYYRTFITDFLLFNDLTLFHPQTARQFDLLIKCYFIDPLIENKYHYIQIYKLQPKYDIAQKLIQLIKIEKKWKNFIKTIYQ